MFRSHVPRACTSIDTEHCDEGAKAPVLSSNRRRPIRCSQVGKSQPHWHVEGSTAELNLLNREIRPSWSIVRSCLGAAASHITRAREIAQFCAYDGFRFSHIGIRRRHPQSDNNLSLSRRWFIEQLSRRPPLG